MKFEQDLCKSTWYDFKKLLWKDELNPRVRCAFGNVCFWWFLEKDVGAFEFGSKHIVGRAGSCISKFEDCRGCGNRKGRWRLVVKEVVGGITSGYVQKYINVNIFIQGCGNREGCWRVVVKEVAGGITSGRTTSLLNLSCDWTWDKRQQIQQWKTKTQQT